MTSTLLTVGPDLTPHRSPDVEIVVPVYNEEVALEASVRRLHAYLSGHFRLSWLVTVADNASTDRTWGIACRLAAELPGVRAVHMDRKGRGLALRAVWSASCAPVVAYMDVDLSTDLDALLPLVAPLLSGHSDVAIGSRLARGARVVRGPKREVISRTYNAILHATLHNAFSDAQCGFKAVRTDVARALLPLVEDDSWFFDTELLVLAEHNGLRIHEVPVDWVDDPDSRVHIKATAFDDLRGIWRLVRRLASGEGGIAPGTLPAGAVTPGLAGQLVRFASVGAVSTAGFAAVFATLGGPVGPIAAATVAFLLCAPLNVAINRRVTFSKRGSAGRTRHFTAGLIVGVAPVAVGLAALIVLGHAGVTSIGADLATLTIVNAIATAARFVLLRRWVFR